MRRAFDTPMFDVWLYEPNDGITGHPDWVPGYIFCPHTKNSVYLTDDLCAKLQVMRHSPHAHMHHWHGEWAVAYTGGACPKFTVYNQVVGKTIDYYRRSVFNDMADQCLVAYKLLDDAGREALVPELWERCQRNRSNRNIPFWSAL